MTDAAALTAEHTVHGTWLGDLTIVREGDALAGQQADVKLVRWATEGCVDGDGLRLRKAWHGIQTASADDSDFCVQSSLLNIGPRMHANAHE